MKERHRRKIRKAQGGLCLICQEPLGGDESIEHVIPKSMGGRGIQQNKALTHVKCNSVKGDEIPSVELQIGVLGDSVPKLLRSFGKGGWNT